MNTNSGIVAAGLLGLLGASTSIHAQGGFAPADMAMSQVRENIYLIRSGASGNVTVLIAEAASPPITSASDSRSGTTSR